MVVREVEKRDGWSDEAGEGEAGAVFWFVGCISAEPADGEEEEVVDWAKRRCEHGELGMFWKDAGFFSLRCCSLNATCLIFDIFYVIQFLYST